MKKLIFTLLFLPLFLTSNAQGDPSRGEDAPAINDGYLRTGIRYAGGTVSFTGWGDKHEDSNGSVNGPKQTNLKIMPEFGYVFSDKLAGSIAAGWMSTTNTEYQFNSSGGDDWELKDKSGLFVINPKIKTYKKLANRLYCTPSLGVSVGFGSMSHQSLEYNFDTNQEEVVTTENSDFLLGAELNAGFKYFLNKNFALTANYGSVYVNSLTETDKEDSNIKWKTNSYGIDLSPETLQLGLIYAF